jgi:aryl-alcohol dehydrogenase-like predicted oxidoreductase
MPTVNLGNTGLKVSKLGFGTFDFGVSSLKINPEKGGQILVAAHKLGVSFWDTSDDYGSHPHLASALKHLPRRNIIISTKTYAKSGEDARKSLKNSLHELGTDYVDIFLLHFVKYDSIDNCGRVLKELSNEKTTGAVKAIGLSTHSVAVVKKAARFEELDVIMAIYCKAEQALLDKFRERIPLEDGSITEMSQAVKLAHDNGKGTVAMKVLGDRAPALVRNYQSAIKEIARLDYVDAMVIGMKNLEEVKKNIEAIASP